MWDTHSSGSVDGRQLSAQSLRLEADYDTSEDGKHMHGITGVAGANSRDSTAEAWELLRDYCFALQHSKSFNLFTMGVIILNAFCLAITW